VLMFSETMQRTTDQPTSCGNVHFELFFGCCVAHPSVLMRASLFANDRRRYTAKHRYVEDLWLWLSLIVEDVCDY
jgi:hypothetical protein